MAKMTALNEGRNPFGLLGGSIYTCLVARKLTSGRNNVLLDQVSSASGIANKTVIARFRYSSTIFYSLSTYLIHSLHREIKNELFELARKHLKNTKLSKATFESSGNLQRIIQYLKIILAQTLIDEERWRVQERERMRQDELETHDSSVITTPTSPINRTIDEVTPPSAKRRKLDDSASTNVAEVKPPVLYLPPAMKKHLRDLENRRGIIKRAKTRMENPNTTEYKEHEAKDFTDPLYLRIAKMLSEGADEDLILQGEFDAAMIEVKNLARPALDDDEEVDQYILTDAEAQVKAEAYAAIESSNAPKR